MFAPLMMPQQQGQTVTAAAAPLWHLSLQGRVLLSWCLCKATVWMLLLWQLSSLGLLLVPHSSPHPLSTSPS